MKPKIPIDRDMPTSLRQAIEFGVCMAFGAKACDTIESIIKGYLSVRFAEAMAKSTPTEVVRLWELWTLITGEKKP